MRIDIVTPAFFPIVGGVETHTYKLAERLEKRNHLVTVHAPYYDKPFAGERAFKLVSYKARKPLYYNLTNWMPKIKETDIIHIQCYDHLCTYRALSAYLNKFPIVLTSHGITGEHMNSLKYKGFRFFFDRQMIPKLNKLKKLILLTENELNWCEKFRVKAPTAIIPNAIEIIDMPDNEVRKIKNRYNIENYILFLGRIAKNKHPEDVVKAFYNIQDRHLDYEVVYAGADEGGLKNIRIGFNYKYLGRIPEEDKLPLIKGARCIVLPSKSEAQPIVLLEALSQGTPCISTKISGIPYTIDDGKNGILIDVGDIKMLSKAIDKILTDESFYRMLSKNALEKARAHYSWDIVIKQIEAVYNEPQQSYAKTERTGV